MEIRMDICHLMKEPVSECGGGWQTGQKWCDTMRQCSYFL